MGIPTTSYVLEWTERNLLTQSKNHTYCKWQHQDQSFQCVRVPCEKDTHNATNHGIIKKDKEWNKMIKLQKLCYDCTWIGHMVKDCLSKRGC